MGRERAQGNSARAACDQGGLGRGAGTALVTRRPLAALDILDVWDHIAEGDMVAADRWVDQLDAALNRLATQPMMGRARPELGERLRSPPFRRHVIFYLPADDGVDVVRVLHSARDVDPAFDDDE